MSEKQFFEIDYDEIYYIIDSSRLQRKKADFEDEEEYQEYCLENSLIGTQVVDLLNSLYDENKQLKQKLENLGLNKKNDMVKMIDGKFFMRM